MKNTTISVFFTRLAIVFFASLILNQFSAYAQSLVTKSAEIEHINQRTPLSKIIVEVLNTQRLGNTMDHDYWIRQFNNKWPPLCDSLHHYYIPKNNVFSVHVRLDSIYPLFYTDSFSNGQAESITLKYDANELLKPLDSSLLFMHLISEERSLEITHISDDNWRVYVDTLILTQENNQVWLEWLQYIGTGEKRKHQQKVIQIDSITKSMLTNFEKQIAYYTPFNKIKFKSCGNCQGIASVISLKMGNYRKQFMEPSCRKAYLQELRQLVFGPKE